MKLPLDCDVRYFADFLSTPESDALAALILDSCTFVDTIEMADGTRHRMDVGKFMFTDPELVESETLHASFGPRQPWLDPVRALKERIEAVSGRTYDVAVCLFYESGDVGAAFHSDLAAYGDVSSIASVSLGAVRRFALRRIDDHDDGHELELAHGSLLLMGEHCQDRYEHSLLIDPAQRGSRINLTFRALGWR